MAERKTSEDQAAFGVFPQLKRNRSKQDREAAKNVPVDLARGALAGVLGAPGDIESLVRMLPYLDEKTVLPTSEDIEKRLPFRSEAPVSKGASGLGILGGGFYTGPLSPLRLAGALPSAIKHGAEEFAKASVAGVPHVVKPKGGNWLNRSVEDELESLKRDTMMGAPNDTVEDVLKKKDALNNWVDRNLTNYVKKEMATPEDPVRKLAEEGITHFPIAEDPRYWARRGEFAREQYGGTQMAQSDLAKQWENRTDPSIMIDPAKRYQELGDLYPEWIKKLDPETSIYQAQGVGGRMNTADLGFDHIMDVLREDVAAGRIRPEQLNKVSMEQAVRRTYEYDQEMARKMREAAIKQTEGFPLHKEYPEGYKWIELTNPKAVPEGYTLPEGMKLDTIDHPRYGILHTVSDPKGITQIEATDSPESALLRFYNRKGGEGYKALEDALKYEGNTMGHCVGGYCPDVVAGRSRIFSLRDAKGEPHVTVEARPKKAQYEDIEKHFNQAHEEVLKDMNARGMDTSDPTKANGLAWKRAEEIANENPQMSIIQIKGKQNAKPKDDYLPFVQDFVRSGNWSDVGDIQNAGLHKLGSEYLTAQEAESKYKPMVADALNYLETHPSLERHRAARQARNDFKGDTTSPEYRDLERKAGENIAKDVPYTYAELKALLSSPEDWTDHGETIYTPLSTALGQIEKAKKSLGPLPPTEGMKRGGVVISNNPDAMMLEVNNAYMAGGGLAKLLRAAPKSAEEIKAIAERMAPQLLGEFVRGDKGTQSVAGKTQKQFAKEKEMKHDIRPTGAERPVPKPVNIEELKDQVIIGIPGDPTISGQTLHSLNDIPLESPSPQHGGPLYGLGHEGDAFWASGLGAANRVQNLAREASQQYDAPVLGKYIMMGPESINYAQHFADANLSAINPDKMTRGQIESFNNLIREGYPYKKKGESFQRVFPAFPGIENPAEAYLHFSIDPELRKHFNALMQMPTITEKHGLPSGIDVRHAITEPDLRDLETGVTGKSIGRLRPDVTKLGLSSHPTYSHDIPGEFLGSSNYPIPYELSFPDTVKAIRENPKQAPHEFGSLKMVGPRQIIDQQMIDEIKQYEEQIKRLTGKKEGGAIKQPAAYIDGNEFVEAAKKYGIKDSMNNLNKIVDLVNKGLTVDDAARQVADTGMHKAAGGAITGDDLIIEERPL